MKIILHPFRKFSLKRSIKKISKCVETELMDDFLELLLKAVRLVLCVNRKFRRNIKDFNARYAFRSEDGKIAASAIFKNNKMKVRKNAIADTNVTVIFKDGKALWEFLMGKDPDVFVFILESKLSYEGNANFLMKFAYMAKHLMYMFGI
jgi:hypothetical protein